MYPYNIQNDTEMQQLPTPQPQPAPVPPPNGTNEEPLPVKPDKKVLDMILQAIAQEKANVPYYADLASKAKDPKDANTLKDMQLGSLKHAQMLSDIYTNIMGTKPVAAPEHKTLASGTIDDYADGMFQAIDAVEFLRHLYFIFLNLEIRDNLYEIITDKQNDALKFSYLYTKNK